MIFGCKGIWIRKSEFVAKTQLLKIYCNSLKSVKFRGEGVKMIQVKVTETYNKIEKLCKSKFFTKVFVRWKP